MLLVALYLAFGLWGRNPVTTVLATVVGWLPRVGVAVVLVLVAGAIARGAKDLVATALAGLTHGPLLASITSVVILGLGVVAALDRVGVATAVTTPVLIAVLATIGGLIVVGVGGGRLRPAALPAPRTVELAELEAPGRSLTMAPRASIRHPE